MHSVLLAYIHTYIHNKGRNLSVPMKKNGCPLVAALSRAWRWLSRFNTGRQYM